MKKPEYLVIPLIILIVILVGIYTVNQPSAAPTYASPEDVVRLAWFYKPPDEEQIDRVAQTFDFFILTDKDEAARDQLKSAGVDTPFSQYLLFLIIEDPGDCDDGGSADIIGLSQNHNQRQIQGSPQEGAA
jgi:hypothetical protein